MGQWCNLYVSGIYIHWVPLTFSGNVLGYPGIMTRSATWHPSTWRAACAEWCHLEEWAMASWYRARFQFLSWCDHERLSLSVASIHSHQHLLYLFLLLKQLSTLDMKALWADLARTFPIRRVWIKIGDDKYDKTQPSIANGHQFLIIFM